MSRPTLTVRLLPPRDRPSWSTHAERPALGAGAWRGVAGSLAITSHARSAGTSSANDGQSREARAKVIMHMTQVYGICQMVLSFWEQEDDSHRRG